MHSFCYNRGNQRYKGDFEMYVNERDQINYHGFLRALREMNQVSQEAVSIGICTVSGMNRFENGNRIAEKLMRDRLTARMGISGEKYEDYLQPKEYVLWQHRLRIVKAIEKRKLGLAKKELHSYEQLPKLNDLNKQFVEAMRFMILSMEGASDEVLLECVNKAVKYTVPNVDKALAGQHLLADQEINLIAEQIRLSQPKAIVRDERAWRISEYEKLISYIENSHWELLQKAKVYPKVTYYICQLLLETEMTEAELRHGLELCHTAIELLRDSSRLYYFIELTEMRRTLAEALLAYDIADAEKENLEEMLAENNDWERVFKELYAEYKVASYMSNFCYLYYETECHDMAEVIEIRRNMLGLSRVKLAEGICNDRTIVRFERQGRNPNIEVVRLLFERLGLCAEYRRAQIFTMDISALVLYNEGLVRAVNGNDYPRAFEYLEQLKSLVNIDIPYNKQELKRTENYLLDKMKLISKEQFAQNIIESLECTVDIGALSNCKEKFLTRSELSCIYDLAFDIKVNVSERCLKIVEEICNEQRIDKKESRISMREWLIARWAGRLSDERRFEASNDISDEILKECLVHYRMLNLWDHRYNIIWNYQQENKQLDILFVYEGIKMCMLMSQIVKEYNVSAFFQNKLKEL